MIWISYKPLSSVCKFDIYIMLTVLVFLLVKLLKSKRMNWMWFGRSKSYDSGVS